MDRPPLSSIERAPESGDSIGHRLAPVSVALVNDYELVVRGLEAMLDEFDDRVRIVELDVQTEPGRPVDVALFDDYGSPLRGVERVRELAASPLVGSVVVYTFHTDADALAELVAAGAQTVVSKASVGSELVASLEAAAGGGTMLPIGQRRARHDPMWPGAESGLTPRESEVAALLCSGAPNRAIAAALCVSENTVKTHLKAVFQKLQVSTRAQAVAYLMTTPSFRRRRPLLTA